MKIKVIYFFLLFFLVGKTSSQESFLEVSDTSENKNGYQMKGNSSEIEANFMSSYYNQDGNNSAVTGGIGTEKLTDFSNVFIVNIPIDKKNSLGIFTGLDNYTSASSDNIDSNISSASKTDTRVYGTISFNRKNLRKGSSYGLKSGFSKEFDYKSFSGAISFAKEWNEGNTEINVNGQAFLDKWLGKHNDLIYPELWLGDVFGYEKITDPKRNSFNAQFNFSQIINPRLIFGITAEVTYMTGLLSTPFHAVYFDTLLVEPYKFDIERLPSSRLKFPIGFRLNYFPVDFMVIRSYYRYYTDDFGIRANTFEIETPMKLTDFLTLSPFYRFYIQSASKYFGEIYTHDPNSQFYTSDHDLSEFSSNKYGLGLKFYPLYGILRSKPLTHKNSILMLKYLELRGAYYKRSNDFSAMNFSINLAFGYK
jgi:hypothetical protein